MDQRISFISLAVRDRAASRAFYLDGLGWQAEFDDVDVIMIRVGEHLILSLWEVESFTAEVGAPTLPGAGGSTGIAPFTLAHNVAAPEAVDEVLARARGLGAEVGEAQQRDWGGYTGYFADPDGYRWEIAYNPGPIGEMVLP